MLQRLAIRSFAIIDRLDVEFGAGLNVLTGETGAGKSIVIDALNLILGCRAGSEMVRGGADRAVVDAVFDIAGSPEVERLVAEMGFDVDDGSLLLTREVSATGKSTCRIGGRPATVAQLREIGDWLVDLHGQHEHQSLMAAARHIDILDEWGGLSALRQSAADAFHARQSLEKERERLLHDARERSHLLDLYQFQVTEIERASLAPGEDEELAAEHRRAANAQRLVEAAAAAAAALAGEGGGALEALAVAARSLDEGAALDGSLQPALESVQSAMYELAEVERDLVRYQDSVEASPDRLAEVADRLELIRTLKRKYGDSIEEILRYGAETRAKLELLSNTEERSAELDREIAAAQRRLEQACARLSEQRRCRALDFQQATLSELRDLGMEKAQFDVHVEPAAASTRGADRVEFLIATNPGEPVRPLARVASGGEISRVMLAIKAAMARQEPLPTMVFDEIDAGVGGRTASVIADKLETLSRAAQILCITHLAQIASRGSRHFYIEKQETGDRTTVSLTPLDADQRIAEIARMIGGAQITPAVLQHAREMLGQEKQEVRS